MAIQKVVDLPFVGVEGDVKIVITPFAFKVYQNGVKVKKKGAFKPKFFLNTADGNVEPMKIRGGKERTREAVFRDQVISLNDPLSILDILILIVLFCSVFTFFCLSTFSITGIIGGGLLGACIGGGIGVTSNMLRLEKNMLVKLGLTLGMALASYGVYVLLGLLVVSILHTNISVLM